MEPEDDEGRVGEGRKWGREKEEEDEEKEKGTI